MYISYVIYHLTSGTKCNENILIFILPVQSVHLTVYYSMSVSVEIIIVLLPVQSVVLGLPGL